MLWRSDFLVPDGWTKPDYLDWCKCQCGMIYADNETVTQADYDTFYKERYGFGVEDDDMHTRLLQRAIYIRDNFRRNVRVVDFGGGESGLTKRLSKMGFTDLTNYQIGDTMPKDCDVIIAEHVIEHIYDLETAMQTITDSLKDNGCLIVDVPDSAAIAFKPHEKLPQLDFSQVHLQHFRMLDMLRLADRYGYELRETFNYPERMMFGRCYIFVKHKNAVADLSKEWVQSNIARKMDMLRKLGDTPVIVWGCGDIAMHLLSQVDVNVQYFVDIDPAYRGATINGLPVKELTDTEHTILVMAQTQKEGLLKYIRKMGVKNEVIQI
jgi:SAM-dependent methyltransferase